MRKKRINTWVALVLITMCLFAESGCQTPQRLISEQELLNRHEDYLRSYESELQSMETRSGERIEAEYRNALTSSGKEPQSYDVLVLSGGGAFGAFGAGFLEGWGQITDPQFSRPEFDSVSGISTGSLIAPFAFVGTPDSYRRIIELYENPGHDWVRKRGLIPYLPGNVSLFDVSRLHDTVRSAITADLIRAIAKGASEGRQLLVGATNLDYGLMRVWDLAQTALKASEEKAVEQTVSVLLASSALPGAFPPVLIDELLYVDGGASMQVVGGLDERSWVYAPDSQKLTFVNDGPPIRIRVWMIVNQKLLPDLKVVQSRWTSIGARSLSTLVRTSTLQSIFDAETYVRVINQRPEFDAQMRYVAIPQDYPIPDTDEMFDADTMRKLVKLGRKMGSDPTSWRTESLRPAAPFRIK